MVEGYTAALSIRKRYDHMDDMTCVQDCDLSRTCVPHHSIAVAANLLSLTYAGVGATYFATRENLIT